MAEAGAAELLGLRWEWEGPCEYREQEKRMLWHDASVSFAA